jgi:hypothetical protein
MLITVLQMKIFDDTYMSEYYRRFLGLTRSAELIVVQNLPFF